MVNIEVVRRYNQAVKKYNDEASKLKAKLEYTEAEFKRKCEELSKMLGTEVNENNIEEIQQNYMSKVEAAINEGYAIINRIEAAENQAVNDAGASGGFEVAQPVQAVGAGEPVQVVQAVQPVQQVQPVPQVEQAVAIMQQAQPVGMTTEAVQQTQSQLSNAVFSI